ncbi:hypothetical protein RUND412_006572 [Rhizina undulata]
MEPYQQSEGKTKFCNRSGEQIRPGFNGETSYYVYKGLDGNYVRVPIDPIENSATTNSHNTRTHTLKNEEDENRPVFFDRGDGQMKYIWKRDQVAANMGSEQENLHESEGVAEGSAFETLKRLYPAAVRVKKHGPPVQFVNLNDLLPRELDPDHDQRLIMQSNQSEHIHENAMFIPAISGPPRRHFLEFSAGGVKSAEINAQINNRNNSSGESIFVDPEETWEVESPYEMQSYEKSDQLGHASQTANISAKEMKSDQIQFEDFLHFSSETIQIGSPFSEEYFMPDFEGSERLAMGDDDKYSRDRDGSGSSCNDVNYVSGDAEEGKLRKVEDNNSEAKDAGEAYSDQAAKGSLLSRGATKAPRSI